MFHIIVNPSGASGSAGKIWETLEKSIQEKGIDYIPHFSSLDHTIPQICKELTETGEEVSIIVVGGDGSINEAMNGFKSFSNVRFGFIPCGSGNDLAEGLGLPKKKEELISILLENKVRRKMDVGEITLYNDNEVIHQRFAISAGLGFDAEICEEVAKSKVKNLLNKLHIGKLSYLVVAIRLIFQNQSFASQLVVDGKEYPFEKSVFLVGMNNRYEGGGFQFCPGAINDDGLLQLCVAHDVSTAKFFHLFPKCYGGSHVNYPEHVTLVSGKEMHIQTNRPVWVHTDGEVVGQTTKASMKLLQEQIQLIV